MNADNLNNARCEINRHFKKKSKKGYQPTTSWVKDDDNTSLLSDSHSIMNRWRNYFCKLLSVHRVNDVWQTAVHTAEPLVPEPRASASQMDTKKLTGCK